MLDLSDRLVQHDGGIHGNLSVRRMMPMHPIEWQQQVVFEQVRASLNVCKDTVVI